VGGAEGIDGVTVSSATQERLPAQAFTAREIMVAAAARELAGFEKWLEKQVLAVPHRKAYLARLAAERIESLEVHEHAVAAAADFGY
jgi:hypothetical protein